MVSLESVVGSNRTTKSNTRTSEEKDDEADCTFSGQLPLQAIIRSR